MILNAAWDVTQAADADRLGRGMSHNRKRDVLAVGERERRERGKVSAVQRVIGCTSEFALDRPELARAGFRDDVDALIHTWQVEVSRTPFRVHRDDG